MNTDAAKRAKPEPVPPPPSVPPLFGGAAVPASEGRTPFGIGDRWPTGLVAPAPPPAAPPSSAEGAASGFMVWKAEHQEFEARLARLRFEREAKSLLPTGEVQRMFAQLGRIVAAVREQLPAQLAPTLIGKTDPAEVEEILRAGYRQADERISQEIESRILTAIAMEPNAAAAA